MASTAQIEANRRNARKSTGPRTDEGKRRSREDAIKHGLTGAGIALPGEDARQVEGRFRALNEELAPQTTLGTMIAHQVAPMSVRMNRAARQEAMNLAFEVRHAAATFEAGAAEAPPIADPPADEDRPNPGPDNNLAAELGSFGNLAFASPFVEVRAGRMDQKVRGGGGIRASRDDS